MRQESVQNNASAFADFERNRIDEIVGSFVEFHKLCSAVFTTPKP